MKINIADRSLWGNEAADDERPNVLHSYFVPHESSDDFFSKDERLVVARARKGMGKSALVNELAYRLLLENESIVINIKGKDLVAQKPVSHSTHDQQIYDWMQRICILINREIGNRINFAVNDDELLLVESAELAGFKRKNLLSSLLSRFKIKLPTFELQSPEIAEHLKVLERINESGRFSIWVLVDDIDATFVNTEEEARRVSTFFSACREIVSDFREIYIRSTVRGDVWASIRKTDESLDKVEQYIIDLKWSRRDIGKLLAKRIQSYKQRTNDGSPMTLREQLLQTQSEQLEAKRSVWESQLREVFPSTYPWGNSKRANYQLLFLLGAGRPRWVLQLCRMASKAAVKQNRLGSKIELSYIKQALSDYSSIRLDDICREHQHQCPAIAEIVNVFSSNEVNCTTGQLIGIIEERIIETIDVVIDGDHVTNPEEIARFLFRTGFFIAQECIDEQIQYYYFEDRPELLRFRSNLDDGFRWSVQPAFRAALNTPLEDIG